MSDVVVLLLAIDLTLVPLLLLLFIRLVTRLLLVTVGVLFVLLADLLEGIAIIRLKSALVLEFGLLVASPFFSLWAIALTDMLLVTQTLTGSKLLLIRQ